MRVHTSSVLKFSKLNLLLNLLLYFFMRYNIVNSPIIHHFSFSINNLISFCDLTRIDRRTGILFCDRSRHTKSNIISVVEIQQINYQEKVFVNFKNL